MVESCTNKQVHYNVGDIIKYERYTPGDETPEIFECLKYDEDWGVVWHGDGAGYVDSVGVAYVRHANEEEIKQFKNN